MASDGKDHRTVSRVAAILELVAKHGDGVRMPDIVKELNAPRSSVHGLVSGLVACRYLEVHGGRYRIGPAIGALLSNRQPLDRIARPALSRLAQDVGETVMLAVRVGDSVVYIDSVESVYPIRYSAPLHERRPMYPSSSGKCFLAFEADDFREDFLSRHIPPAKRAAVRAEIERVVEAGYSVNHSEILADVLGIAVPVWSRGQLVACVAVAGPVARMDAGGITTIAKRAVEAATSITEALDGGTLR